MSGICKPPPTSRSRSGQWFGLFLLGLLTLLACQNPPETATVALRWRHDRAVGVSIPTRLVHDSSSDSLPQLLAVRLTDNPDKTAILGDYQVVGDTVIFEPLIPFTRGLQYEIWLRNQRLGGFQVPVSDSRDAPELLAILPSQDSLPDNVLKIYLRFSRPMREGQSQKHVVLLKNGVDTVRGAFLDLQPELWNPDRTRLTLWLDPGRIKRDLQPNKLLGNPLQSGGRYQLLVSKNWPDQQGTVLGKAYSKSFVTLSRDSLSPNPVRWMIKPPQAGGLQPLEIRFNESLDAGLLPETLHVLDESEKTVSGCWQVGDEEKNAHFKPVQGWKPGRYVLRVEARLEDLAGNNLNRPFDRDVTQKTAPVTTGTVFDRPFQIKP